MDEATKQALNAFVQQMITAAQNGAKWTADQAPLLVQEWLRWQFTEAALSAFGLALVITVLFIVTRRFFKNTDIWPDTPLPVITLMVACVLCVPFAANVMAAAKVLVAPRVVVLEKFMKLVK